VPEHVPNEADSGSGNRLLNIFISLVAIAFSLFHLYLAGVGTVSIAAARHIHLILSMTLIFLIYPLSRKSPRHWTFFLDLLLILLAVTVGLYLEIQWEALAYRAMEPTTLDSILGVITLLLTLEIARRVVGLPIIITVCVFIAYDRFGAYIPGYFGHKGHDLTFLVNAAYAELRGIYGMPLGIVVKFVVLFIIFGAFLRKTGAGDFFVNLSYALTGRMRGGPAKTAVMASALMGSISGSTTANVVTTGSFTIPMMKSIGYPAHIAGGVEVASSVGGVLLPPVMGAAAFLIVALTGIPYVKVIKTAAIPAFMYFVSVFASVHFMACRLNLKGIPWEGNYWKNLFGVLWKGIHHLIPLALLVYLLLTGYSPSTSAFFSILCLIAVSYLRKESRLGLRDMAQALELGARNSLTVSAACAAVGVIVGVVGMTGIGVKFSSIIVSAAGGYVFVSIIFVGLASLVLGIELPITASYLLVAILAAPALNTLGVPILVAHLIVLWFSIDAAVTPPVCITAYVAAGVAKADPFKTGFAAWKMAKGLYVIPFLMAYTPITLDGTLPQIIIAVLTGCIGLISLTAAWEGYLISRANLIERIALAVVTVASLKPGFVTDIIGVSLFISVLAIQWYRGKRTAQGEIMETVRSRG
jgi:TRAP transporter 4TM/12TM fusion protein